MRFRSTRWKALTKNDHMTFSMIKLSHNLREQGTDKCSSHFGWRPTHNVHDGEDVALHVFHPVVLHHLGISHHQRLHPPLFANRALSDSPALPLLVELPAFPLPFHALCSLMGTWQSETEHAEHAFRYIYIYVCTRYIFVYTSRSLYLYIYVNISICFHVSMFSAQCGIGS